MRKAFPDNDAPEKVIDFLNTLIEREPELGDRYIRYHEVRKTPEALEQEAKVIQFEVAEMLDPDLAIYPNPTWTCGWDCPYQGPCLEYMDGNYPQDILDLEFQAKAERPETWFDDEVTTWQGSNGG